VKPGVLDSVARRLVLNKLSGLRGGEVAIADHQGVARLGDRAGLRAEIEVRSPRFYRQVAIGGGLAAAASYLSGDWECDDLTTLFRILGSAENEPVTAGVSARLSRLAQLGSRLYHRLRSNSRTGSRKNIQAHYDLGNDFFRLWLDDTWAYSCGVFPSATSTLREASVEKFDRICRKLDLRSADHLLEIGAGWGGMAIHAATHYGCRVTTTTISAEQHQLATERIAEAGLADRVTVLRQDYRDLTGQFDKLVSIEMIEAVGYKYFDTYFRQCGRLLKPNGTMALQAIVLPENGYDRYLRSVDFIQRYVFPGGCLPTVAAMLDSAGRTTRFRLAHVEEFGLHYAETIRHWSRAFEDRLPEVRRLGYTEDLIRLWRYYLAYCEAAFKDRHVGVVQLQFDQPHCRRDTAQIGAWAAGGRVSDASADVANDWRAPLATCRD